MRQFFMRHPAEERAQFHLVEEALGGCTGIVTFNCRVRSAAGPHRFVLAGMPLPLSARRTSICCPRAAALEGAVGIVQPGRPGAQPADVSAHLRGRAGLSHPRHLPQFYLSGGVTECWSASSTTTWRTSPRCRCCRADGAPLQRRPILSDNWPICTRWNAGAWGGATTRWTGRGGHRRVSGRVDCSFRRRAEPTQILRDLAYLFKRLERRDEAVEVWESWIATLAGDDLTPYIELAKHHEWVTLDQDAARGLSPPGRCASRKDGRPASHERRRWLICATGWKGWNVNWQGNGAIAPKQNSVAPI